MAVTGSASPGVADSFSALELNFWVDEVPPPGELQAWLRSRGVQVEALVDALDDGSLWLRGWSGGLPIEAGWQPLAVIEADLHGLLAADPAYLPRLVMAWTVRHALPLVSGGQLGHWQAALTPYPEALRQRLVGAELAR